MLLRVIACCLLSLLTSAARATPTELSRAQGLLRALKHEEALAAFNSALEDPRLSPRQRAAILVDVGICHLELLQEDKARAAFRNAATLDSGATLPHFASPKVRRIFEDERSLVSAARPLPGPSPAGLPTMQPRQRWAWKLAGIAAVALATSAAVAAAEARSQQGRATSAHFASEAERLHTDAQSRAKVANLLLGGAGSAAVVSGILFFTF